MFLSHYYVHCSMIMTKNTVFASPLCGLKRKSFFFQFTTYTTPWSREKKLFCCYGHYAMIKIKNFFFSFQHYARCAMVTVTGKWHLIFIAPLLWIMKKIFFFSFHHYANIFLLHLTHTYYAHCVTNLSKKYSDKILPPQNMCNLN